ncbi:MAG: alpha/beta hydrolase [Acidobacteria bacterium]|nr:alpha/beta hydrolase [Acidobacteriota bacterium]
MASLVVTGSLLTRLAGVLLALLAAAAILKLLVIFLEARLAFFPFSGVQETPRGRGIEYEERSIATADGETLHGWVLRPPSPKAEVLYFHGNGGNLSIWLDILDGLYRQGLTVTAFDYRGYGRSTGSPSEQGLYRDTDAMLGEFWRHSRQPDSPIIYWGRSLGGTMAAYAASKRAPDGLVLESAFPSARALLRPNVIMAILGLFSSYRFPTAIWLANVGRPVLVMHGDADSIVPFELGQQLFATIRGSKRFHRIAGGDHNDAAPRDPEPYWRAVTEFVSDLPRR